MSSFFIAPSESGTLRFQEGGVAPEGATQVSEDVYRTRIAEAATSGTSPTMLEDISSAQAKIQLARTSLTNDVGTLLDAVTSLVADADVETKIWFSDARTWQRRNPYVAEIGQALGLSEAEIDDLFRSAAEIAA